MATHCEKRMLKNEEGKIGQFFAKDFVMYDFPDKSEIFLWKIIVYPHTSPEWQYAAYHVRFPDIPDFLDIKDTLKWNAIN